MSAIASKTSHQAHVLPFSQTFHATATDVDEVRSVLENKNLPPEFALRIVSLTYHPWLAKRRVHEGKYHVSRSSNSKPTSDGSHITGLYLSSDPIPDNGRRADPQRIIFQTRAAGQGRADAGGDGTFQNSHTWFEASILRPFSQETGGNSQSVALEDALPDPWQTAVTMSLDDDSPRKDLRRMGWDFVEAEDGRITWKVCHNITASGKYRNYRVEWKKGVQTAGVDETAVGRGEGFLELLQPGFIVVLWARAQQWNSENKVEAATIEIEYEL
ncbi:hypothetical protein Hte_009004 [Hypoxylon texense]